MAFILRQIADDLESGGIGEWDSFDDAAQGTANNVTHDFNEYRKEVVSKTEIIANSIPPFESSLGDVLNGSAIDFDSTDDVKTSLLK